MIEGNNNKIKSEFDFDNKQVYNGLQNDNVDSEHDTTISDNSNNGQVENYHDSYKNKDINNLRKDKRIKDLKKSKAFWLISMITKWADKYFLDALLGFIPSVGDLVSSVFGLPFIYVSLVKVKSISLTLAIIYNYLVDILLGSIPFFIGDAIDFFSKAHVKNLNLITRYVEGDKKTIRQVRSKALLTGILILVLCIIIYFVFRLLIGVTEWTWNIILTILHGLMNIL
ncbi:DUF4112 domain-containing protein [Prevotella melaninogenica]|uniref:DUF4112 domain-containing protein n=1 Tax=Prevotella TaxID=838 RepID=UPI0003AD4509|nr:MULTISPECIES: DUF4112 domain-containing protein [Prevotella]ERJ77092.1 hypothetical protein HMPREF9148_01450 [Prevotella sp. F0091]QUB74193.1 DUF4112 domain-containing protein [Prevotella melaninogenica]